MGFGGTAPEAAAIEFGHCDTYRSGGEIEKKGGAVAASEAVSLSL